MNPSKPSVIVERMARAMRTIHLEKTRARDLLVLSRRAHLLAESQPEGTRRRLLTFSRYLSALVQASRTTRPGVVSDILRLLDEMLLKRPLTPPPGAQDGTTNG